MGKADPEYIKHYGMPGEQVWRRGHLEMGFIRYKGRESDLPVAPTWDEVHNLAEQILDEEVAKGKKQVKEWNDSRRAEAVQDGVRARTERAEEE
jgi:hypothetical protein